NVMFCSDTKTDPRFCGGCNKTCPLGDTCANATCTCAAMICNNTMLGMECTDEKNDPDNCGACNKMCASGQMCSGGACKCRPGCNACPCPACRSGDACCTYPSTTIPICIAGATCPTP